MTLRSGLLLPSLLMLSVTLSGCAHLTDQVRNSMNLATTLTQACTQPRVRNISSPESIAQNLQAKALADFGFADRPVNVPLDYRTSYSIQSALTSLHDILAAIEEEDKAGFADSIAASNKMRTDAREIKATLQTEFVKWKANIKSACGANNNESIACYVDFSAYAQTATAAVHDDFVTLDNDTQDFTRKLKLDLAKSKNLDQSIRNSLTQDSTRLTRYIAVMLVLLDEIAQHERIQDCAQCQVIFADAADAGKQYLAYEAANITMNQLDHIARSAESKLDEIDQKSWFILSVGDFVYSKAIADKVSATLVDALPKKQVQIGGDHSALVLTAQSFIDGHYLQDAATAYSCKRIAADMSGSDANAVRTETLLYPVYAGLICGFNETDSAGRPTRLCDSATTPARPPPPTLVLTSSAPAAPANLTGLFIAIDARATQQNQGAGKAAGAPVNRTEIKQLMNANLPR